MKISDKLRKEIEKDIKLCNEYSQRNGSMSLYNEMVAKYIVIDKDFENGLSVMGKATVLGQEFDYRKELKAIASKLSMWLVLYGDADETDNPVKIKVKELLLQGESIRAEEYHEATEGFMFPYVSGPKFSSWMESINILSERYLKNHPSYESIHKLYIERDYDFEAFEKMMPILNSVYSDEVFWNDDNAEDTNAIGDEDMIENKNVFIVHGHDETAKLKVARFLEKCGFNAVILHEKPDAGCTIIEKLEENTNVIFAIVLYTPCDIGHCAIDGEEKPRARQNVVFEHGYLIGKLGRKRVCALVKGDVEIPGDYSGVIYKKMDNEGAWEKDIIKEMKSLGIEVDANKIFN